MGALFQERGLCREGTLALQNNNHRHSRYHRPIRFNKTSKTFICRQGLSQTEFHKWSAVVVLASHSFTLLLISRSSMLRSLQIRLPCSSMRSDLSQLPIQSMVGCLRPLPQLWVPDPPSSLTLQALEEEATATMRSIHNSSRLTI